MAKVRVNQLSPAERRRTEDLPYAGARHTSALETSTRKDVFAAITLSGSELGVH